jgi:hypothetical protein
VEEKRAALFERSEFAARPERILRLLGHLCGCGGSAGPLTGS